MKDKFFEKTLFYCECFIIVSFLLLIGYTIYFWKSLSQLAHLSLKKGFLLCSPYLIYFLTSAFFWLVLNCPKCGCHILTYFGGGLFQFFTFKTCPKCGYELRS